jgi:hypothetical protein
MDESFFVKVSKSIGFGFPLFVTLSPSFCPENIRDRTSFSSLFLLNIVPISNRAIDFLE